ncbi:malonyl-CoA synthase [Rhodobacteraceae bacterium WD3A24]|nr:malonyl-CoA synthase [Rhodobacteraceae bacterium WD3A24]
MAANPLYDRLFAPLNGRESAFVILPDGTALSGDAFHAMLARAAGALSGQGVGPGDRVAVQVEKSPEALAVYGAAVALGAVFLPLNPAYTPQEVDYFAGNAKPRLLLADPSAEAALGPVAARHGCTLMTLDAAGGGSFAETMGQQPASLTPASRHPGDLAALLYTSGTTGRSKGAMLTQHNLLSNAEVLVEAWRFTGDDVLLHALPIFHTHGLFVACNVMLLAGGAMIYLPKFDAGEVIRLMPQATAMMGVPTFYTRLLDDPRFSHDASAHMRLFTSGSAPLLAETHTAFEACTGHRILERYGMTETNMTTSNPYDGERRPGTVGPPLPGVELRVTDPETGAPLPGGEIGMIEVRGPNVFEGYWRMPEKTAEEFRADGFFITGDLGFIDADGYVTIVGREKDLIISGGLNVYPKEVELVLDDQPGVRESAVIGVPHPDLGEAVLAVLVPESGAEIDARALHVETAAYLAGFKQPKALVTAEALPRNAMGKVQKALLRRQYADHFTGSGKWG